MNECYEHDYVSTNCINCGGYLGQVCENCGDVSDGGDWFASQEEIWCHCADSVSNYDYIHGWDNPNDQEGYYLRYPKDGHMEEA